MRCNDEMSNEPKMVTCIKLSQIIITEHNRHDFDCLHTRVWKKKAPSVRQSTREVNDIKRKAFAQWQSYGCNHFEIGWNVTEAVTIIVSNKEKMKENKHYLTT